MSDEYVKGKSKETLLSELKGTAQPGSVVHEQQKMGIIVRCTEDLERAAAEIARAVDRFRASAEESTRAADRLSGVVFWLNVIIAIATVLATVISGLALYHEYYAGSA